MGFSNDAEFYENNGYLVVKNFLSPEEVEALKGEARKLIAEHVNKPEDVLTFADEGNEKWESSLYRTTLFVESKAVDENGKIILPSDRAVHKIAHGLQYDPSAVVSKKTIYSDKIKDLIRTVAKHEQPKVTQIMYLLKPPQIGSPRKPHQDETYLRTDPAGHLVGVWIALDDATEENGCLDFVPGSHKVLQPVTRLFRKMPQVENGRIFRYDGDADYMREDSDYEYVRCPVSSGDLVLIHGLVLHKSEPNRSSKSRWAWAFHAWDQKDGVTIPTDNTIQHPDRLPDLYSSRAE